MFRQNSSQRHGKAKGMKVKHLVHVVALTVLFTWFMYQFSSQHAEKIDDVDDELLITDPGAIVDSRFLIDRNEIVQTAAEVAHEEFIDRQSVRESLRRYRNPLDETGQFILDDEADRLINEDADDSLEAEGDGSSYVRLDDVVEIEDERKGLESSPEKKNRARKELAGARNGEVGRGDQEQPPRVTGTTSRSNQEKRGDDSVPERKEDEQRAVESLKQDIFDDVTATEDKLSGQADAEEALPAHERSESKADNVEKIEAHETWKDGNLTRSGDGELAISQHRSGAVLPTFGHSVSSEVHVTEREPGEDLHGGLSDDDGKSSMADHKTASDSLQDSHLELGAAISDLNSSVDDENRTPAEDSQLPVNIVHREEKLELEATDTLVAEDGKIEQKASLNLSSKDKKQNQSEGISQTMK